MDFLIRGLSNRRRLRFWAKRLHCARTTVRVQDLCRSLASAKLQPGVVAGSATGSRAGARRADDGTRERQLRGRSESPDGRLDVDVPTGLGRDEVPQTAGDR